MTIIALLKDNADLERACQELGDFFAFKWQKHFASCSDQLIGIWIDTNIDLEPDSITINHSSYSARIRETVGLSGIWNLCWIDVPDAKASLTILTREALVQALAAKNQGSDISRGQFIPVFSSDTPKDVFDAEMKTLRLLPFTKILEPAFQDCDTGRLLLREQMQC